MNDVLTRIPFTPVASIKCTAGTVHLHPDGYIVSDLALGETQTRATAWEMFDASEKLIPGHRTCTMVLVNNAKPTREGRQAFEEFGEHLTSRVALVVNSRASRVVGNFFLKLNSPPYPVRLFSEHTAAMEWLAPHVGEPLTAVGLAKLEAYRNAV